MKKESIDMFFKQKNVVIPMFMYRCIKRLNIDVETFMFLMYLHNMGEKVIFNPIIASEDFGVDIAKIMQYIDKLTTAKLIGFELIKNQKNVTEEYLSLSFFYDKLTSLAIEEFNTKKDNTSDRTIFELIEKEFGRILSPIEYEIIKAWLENKISEELINEALKEAVFNGVNNLRYIDKILYEWQKKGINTKEDVEKNRIKHKETNNKKVDVFEYNWLEDDE